MSLPPDPVSPVPPQQLSYAAPALEGIVLTPRAFDMLRQTRPWVAFIGLVMLVIGLLVLVGSLIAAIYVLMQSSRPEAAAPLLIYVLVALLYLFPGMILRRYAARIRDLINMRRSDDLEAALEAQKSFWRLAGILTAIVIGIYVAVLVLAFGFAGLGFLR